MLLLPLLFFFIVVIDAKYCKPVDIIMTRASGQEGLFSNGTWSTKYPLDTVNLASVRGALQFVMMETIDAKVGYVQCRRKNEINFIHFYRVTLCQTDAALWWFNLEGRRGPYGPKDDLESADTFSLGEFGHFISFDDGACHDENTFCHYLIGNQQRPKLGPYIGIQDISSDRRNPTRQSYWYSLPGYCPLHTWGNKKDGCDNDTPSGRCPEGIIPDGDQCTWSYQMLGQVNIDDMVGITSIVNNQTEKNFTGHHEYCKAGLVEFRRNSSYHMVDGLPFWENPLDVDANEERAAKMMEFYATDEHNIAVPSVETLEASNPRCYQSRPGCHRGNEETCRRNEEMLCVNCKSKTCGVVSDSGTFPIKKLEKVPFTSDTPQPSISPSPSKNPHPTAPTPKSPAPKGPTPNTPTPKTPTPGKSGQDGDSSSNRALILPSLVIFALFINFNL